MGLRFEPLGNYIHEVDVRNTDLSITKLMGVNLSKQMMPSVANIIGTDLSVYKIVKERQFACKLMSVGRDACLPIALKLDAEPVIISSAYYSFEVNDENEMLPEYLMLCFLRPDFDRELWFRTGGDVRGGVTWDAFCNIEIPVKTIDEQRIIVRDYQVINNRIDLLQKKNQALFDLNMAFFMEKFDWCLHEEMKKAEGYVHLGDFIHVKHGFAFDGGDFSERETSRVLVSPGNFKIGGGFQNVKPKYYSEIAEYDENYVLSANSLVVTMTDLSINADTLGYPAIIPADPNTLYLHNQRVGLVQVIDDRLPVSFLFCLMCSQNYRNYIIATSSGTTVHHTSPERIEGYGFIYPNNTEDLYMLSSLFRIYCSDCDLYNSEIRSLKKLLLLMQQSIF